MTDDPSDRWRDELDDLARRESLPATGVDGPEPPLRQRSVEDIKIESRCREVIRACIADCPCQGVAPIWHDDEDAQGSWSRVVRLYEDLR